MPTRALGRFQDLLILQLARRRKGVTRTECAERFGVSYLAVWRTFVRLCATGQLQATPLRRRRSLLYPRCPKGSVVFRPGHREN